MANSFRHLLGPVFVDCVFGPPRVSKEHPFDTNSIDFGAKGGNVQMIASFMQNHYFMVGWVPRDQEAFRK